MIEENHTKRYNYVMNHIFTNIARRNATLLVLGAACVITSFSVGMQTAGNVQPFALTEADSTLQAGDITADGTVDLHDVVFILESVQGYRRVTPEHLRGDPNEDGALTVDDALHILSRLIRR